MVFGRARGRPGNKADGHVVPHGKQREIGFWNYHHKSIKAHILVAATVFTGRHVYMDST
jgi:hypothetical protein